MNQFDSVPSGGPFRPPRPRGSGPQAAAGPRLWTGPARPGIRGAVLFELDALIRHLPELAEPGWVRPLPGAASAVALARRQGAAIGVLAEQPAVARGTRTPRQADLVRLRVEQLLGPLDAWALCPHGRRDRCGCHRPAPGLVLAASRALAPPPARSVLVGARPGTVAAAEAAGVAGVLIVPDPDAPRGPVGPVRHAPGLLQALARALALLGPHRYAVDPLDPEGSAPCLSVT